VSEILYLRDLRPDPTHIECSLVGYRSQLCISCLDFSNEVRELLIGYPVVPGAEVAEHEGSKTRNGQVFSSTFAHSINRGFLLEESVHICLQLIQLGFLSNNSSRFFLNPL